MDEDFIITVNHNGIVHDFTAKLLQQGYTHKFELKIGGTIVFFEPDDAGSYRVIKMPWQDEKELLKLDKTLLAAVSEKIEAILC